MSKDFPLGVVLSLTTGKMLCNFRDMHEAAELVLGHPIWTHEFADQGLHDKIKQQVLAQHPDLADVTGEDVTPDNYTAWMEQANRNYGHERTLVGGRGERAESPIESLQRIAPGKPVIGVVVE